MSNVLEAFLKGFDPDQEYVKYMTKDEFSRFLRKKGYSYPTHERPGSRYLNVFGAAARVNTKKPYALVVYHPRNIMREEYFETPEAAKTRAPDGAWWQVINLWTMDVIYDPFNMEDRNGSDQ